MEKVSPLLSPRTSRKRELRSLDQISGLQTRVGAQQFSSGQRTDYLPRWSPDGSRLAFLSDRSEVGKFQIYLLERDGGEAIQVTNFKNVGEILQLEWSKSGERIAFLMYDPETDDDRNVSVDSGGAIQYEKNHKYARICVLNVDTKIVEWQTKGNYHVWEFAWSPDEKSFAALIADEPYEWSWHISSLGIISMDSPEKPKIIHVPRPRQIARILWSLEGKSIYFISAIWSDRGLVAGDLYTIPTVGGMPVNLTNDALGSVHYFNWFSGEDLLILSVNWAKSKFTFLNSATGKFTDLCEGEIGLSDIFQPKFSISTNEGNRKISVVREDLSSPSEVWIADIDRQKNTVEWKQVSELNKELKEKYSGLAAKLIEWESFDGLKIQGFLYLPQVPEQSRRRGCL